MSSDRASLGCKPLFAVNFEMLRSESEQRPAVVEVVDLTQDDPDPASEQEITLALIGRWLACLRTVGAGRERRLLNQGAGLLLQQSHQLAQARVRLAATESALR